MKPYAFILILIRFLAVALVVFHLYLIGSLLLSGSPDSGFTPSGMERFVEYTRRQTFLGSIKNIGASTLLYFFAPFLTRLITLGSRPER